MRESNGDLARLVRKNFGVGVKEDLPEILIQISGRFRIPARKSNYVETKNTRTREREEIYANTAYTLERACELTPKNEAFFKKMGKRPEKISYLKLRGKLLIPGFEPMRILRWPKEDKLYTPLEISQEYGISKSTVEALATIPASNKRPLLAKSNGKITGESLLKLYQTIADYITYRRHKHHTGAIPEEQFSFYKLEGQKVPIKSGKKSSNSRAMQNILNAFAGYFEGLDSRIYYLFKFDFEGSGETGVLYVAPQFPQSHFHGDDISRKFADLFRTFKTGLDQEAKIVHSSVELKFVDKLASEWYFGGMYTTKGHDILKIIEALGINTTNGNIQVVRDAASFLKSFDGEAGEHLKPVLRHVVNLYKQDYQQSRAVGK